jgi:glycine hydroxymethyltransferase
VSRESETIDYDALEKLAVEKEPKLIVTGGSAYARIIDFARMRQICNRVGALLLVDMAHFAGLVAAGVHPTPVPHADIVTSTTHKTLRGPRAGMILSQATYAKAIDKVVFPGMQGGPLVHIMAAKATCFLEAMQPEFQQYQQQVAANAKALAKKLIDEGFHVVSGGTDTHLMVVDVFSKGVRGKEAENALHSAHITISRSTIPFDANPPMNPSGIRVGSQAVTTRGMKEPEMEKIGGYIAEVLRHPNDESRIAEIRNCVLALTEQYPLYGWLRSG